MEVTDYVWREKLWELKSISSVNSADKQTQKGIHQIEKRPGGIIIDMTGKKVGSDAIEYAVIQRVRRSAKFELDVILKEGDKLIKIIRYNKTAGKHSP